MAEFMTQFSDGSTDGEDVKSASFSGLASSGSSELLSEEELLGAPLGDEVDSKKSQPAQGPDSTVPGNSKQNKISNTFRGAVLKGIVSSVKEHFGFITPSETLPSEYENRDVHFSMKSVDKCGECSSEEKFVDLHDEVEFILDKRQKTRPRAITLKIVVQAKASQAEERNVVKLKTKRLEREQVFVRGRLCNVQRRPKGDYGFLKLDKTSSEHVGKDVIVYFDRVSCGGMTLTPGDFLDAKLGSALTEYHGNDCPRAMSAKLVHCANRSPEEVSNYLTSLLSRLIQLKRDGSNVTVNVIDILTCHAPWQSIGDTIFLQPHQIDQIMEVLCTLEDVSQGFPQHYKDLLGVFSMTRFFDPWKGILSEYIQNVCSVHITVTLSLIQEFLTTILRSVPRKARVIVKLIKPMRCSEGTAQFFYTLLKEMAKNSSDDVEDMEWDELPLVPSMKELLGGALEDRANLSEVKTKGPYDSEQEYIDTYFRLLRADCFSALVNGIFTLLRGKLDPRDMNVYHDVSLAGIIVTKSGSGVAVALKVTPHRHVKNWAMASNLMFGNLLCITPTGNFSDTLWATVSNRDVKMLQQQQIILVELFSECNHLSDADAILRMEQCSGTMVMVESPTYYRAYQPVLKALQNINPEKLPFKSELVDVQPPLQPEFCRAETCVDHSVIYKEYNQIHEFGNSATLEEFVHFFELRFTTELDRSQEKAVVKSVKRRIAIVQGPPGTGKTFIGVKLLQILLSMTTRPDTPVLVLTYKNHALDEFIKQVVELYPGCVARLGGRSQDPAIEKCNLSELRQTNQRRLPSAVYQLVREKESQVDSMKPEVEDAAKKLDEARYFSSKAFAKQMSNVQVEKLLKNCRHILQTKVQSILDKVGRQNLVSSVAEDNGDVVQLVNDALEDWSPAVQIFEEIQSRYVATINLSGLDDEYQSDKESKKEISQDDRDIEDEQRERLAAVSNRQRREHLILFNTNIDKRISLLSCMKNAINQLPIVALLSRDNVWSLPEMERGLLIQIILYREVEEAGKEFQSKLHEYNQICKEKEEFDLQRNVDILQSMKVIGMTITGASIHHSLLAQIKPAIVLVEEAAEVLEPQLLAALGCWTQQLILIGDHKQLRPPVESYTLVRKYHFDVSMMERLINNNFPHEMLHKQNRMRPEFAQLLTDIYPNLVSNFERVRHNEAPKCVAHSMYFWDHDDLETDERSYSNNGEADRVIQLALFLIQQEYKPHQITILGAYLGQVALIRKKMQAVEKDPRFSRFFPKSEDEDQVRASRIKIHTIDLYQGDENEVVIVSLVRSNINKNIGFLKSFNRRCVCQSRAKCGMYFVGNTETFSCHAIWKFVIDEMRGSKKIGYAIPLRCPDHADAVVHAMTAHDIPMGSFCKHECVNWMSCGEHHCRQLCQPKHSHNYCKVRVLFTFDCGHVAEKFCSEDQNTMVCKEKVTFKFPCKHPGERECNENQLRMKCTQIMAFVFASCKHVGERRCYEQESGIICREACPRKLKCGHPCMSDCGSPCNHDNCKECRKIVEAEKARQRKVENEQKRNALAHAADMLEKLKKKPCTGCTKIELQPTGDTAADYYFAHDLVKNYIQPGHKWYPTVTKIEKLINNKLEQSWYESMGLMANPTKKDYKFHGTDTAAVKSIVEDGFRLPAKAGMYGAGIYFASDSSKSAQEMYTKGSNMLLVCNVILGKSLTVDTATPLDLGRLKSKGYDSIFARRDTKSTGGVLYDEFVIFDPRRALPCFIVHYKTSNISSIGLTPGNMVLAAQSIVKHTLTASRQVTMSETDMHYRTAESQFLRFMQRRGLVNQVEIKFVEFYVNPTIIGKFEAMKQKMGSKYPGKTEADPILAFHGTADSNISSIVRVNFSIAKLAANTGDRGSYGAGIYVSEFPETSMAYGQGSNKLLLCWVLPGRSFNCHGSMLGAPLQPGYDSHIAGTDQAGRGQEIVIYDPDQIWPCYVINFGAKP